MDEQMHLRVRAPDLTKPFLVYAEKGRVPRVKMGNEEKFLSIPVPAIVKGRFAYTAAMKVLRYIVTWTLLPPQTQLHVVSSHFEDAKGNVVRTSDVKTGINGTTKIPHKYVVKWRTCSADFCGHTGTARGLVGIFEFEFSSECDKVAVHTIQDVQHLGNIECELGVAV